jgi:hypothetical protein
MLANWDNLKTKKMQTYFLQRFYRENKIWGGIDWICIGRTGQRGLQVSSGEASMWKKGRDGNAKPCTREIV